MSLIGMLVLVDDELTVSVVVGSRMTGSGTIGGAIGVAGITCGTEVD